MPKEEKSAINEEKSPTKEDKTSSVKQKPKHERKSTDRSYPKLVNFCAATPEKVPWDQERRDELFKSVFQY